MMEWRLRKLLGFHTYVLLAAAAGVITGFWPLPGQQAVAQTVIHLFMNCLNLVSLPIIFLALCTTICGMETVAELKWLGRKVVTYTLATTVVAASIALALFVWLNPAADASTDVATAPAVTQSYLEHILALMPRHVFQPFMEGNVVAVLLLAVVFGLALLQVPDRDLVQRAGTACLAALMKIIRVACLAIPAVVWAGVTVSFQDLQSGSSMRELLRYLICIVAANLLQGLIVLPLFLRAHGIAPFKAMRAFWPALSLAFFSKSSVATIPLAIERAEAGLQVHPKVARFTFPICTTINMNGCAAFILVTVLFVSTAHGRVYAPWELIMWIGVATLAAVGNAGVPMGCYFLASAFLAAMGVPLTKMALILPFYSMLDMVETALNVWSDGCVAMMVNTQYEREGARVIALAHDAAPGASETLQTRAS